MTTTQRSFPTAETHLFKILNDQEFRRSFRAKLKTVNPLIVAGYRTGLLPLLGFSRTVMLLTTRGRKSKKLRATPVGYFRIGGAIHLFSAWRKGASWYKNLASHPDEVWIQVGLRKRPVCAQVLTDADEIQRTLEQFVTESPGQAHDLLGWNPESDRMDSADFSTVFDQVLVVRFLTKTHPVT